MTAYLYSRREIGHPLPPVSTGAQECRVPINTVDTLSFAHPDEITVLICRLEGAREAFRHHLAAVAGHLTLPEYTCRPGECTCGAHVSADGTVTPAGAA